MTWGHAQQKIKHLHAEAVAIKPLICRSRLFRKFSSEIIANNSSTHGRTLRCCTALLSNSFSLLFFTEDNRLRESCVCMNQIREITAEYKSKSHTSNYSKTPRTAAALKRYKRLPHNIQNSEF